MQKFSEKWKAFRDQVCHGRSYTETENYRRVFYAGAIAMMTRLEVVDLSKGEGMQEMLALIGELKDFQKEIDDDRQREFAPRRKEF